MQHLAGCPLPMLSRSVWSRGLRRALRDRGPDGATVTGRQTSLALVPPASQAKGVG